jgi:acyl-CoA dehydrogenase
MDFQLTDDQKSSVDRSQEFAKKEIAPFVDKFENDLALRKQVFQKMAKEGFFLLCVPKNHAGTSIGTVSYLLALEAISKVDAGIAVAMSVTNMVTEAIYRNGSKQLCEKYLSGFMSGKYAPASFAMTEKNAGSDVKSIQTTSQRDGADVIINGEKQFITNGDLAEVILVFAQSSDGMNAFLVDRNTSGLSVIKKERKLGLLSANLVSLRFDQCRISASQQIGERGQGLKIALSALDSGRISIAAQALGIAKASYEAAVHFSKERQQFGHPICENQAIAFKLADMHVKISAGEMLLFKVAWKKDQGLPFTLEASEAKLFCSEMCNEVAADALQIHGGYGYIKDYPVERYFRDARVTTLYEGTSEIQRLIISRKILNTVVSSQ